MQFQRILLVVHHYPPRRVGGAELLTRRLAQWLARHGVAVHVLCVENIERGVTTATIPVNDSDGDVQVTRLNVTLSPNEDIRLWYDHPSLGTQVEAVVDSWRPDLLHLVS